MIRPRDDDALVAQVRKNIRAEELMFGTLLVTALIVAALFVGILKFQLPLQSTGFAALAVFVVWIAMVFRIQRGVRPTGTANSEAILRRTIDDQHRRWRWYLGFAFLNVAVGAITIIVMLAFAGTRHTPWGINPAAVVFALYLASVAIPAALQICYGPNFLSRASRRVLNDELTRTMQRGAAMFGYILAIVLMCLVLAAATVRPQWGLVAMPGAIAVAVILPGLYFIVRQWLAGRDG